MSPLKDWNDKTTWDEAYYKGAEGDTGHPSTRPEVKLHYVRYVQYLWAANRAQGIANALGWTPPGSTIAIVGAGYGWTVEALEQMGYDREDWAGKPVIAIVNTWSDINPCHAHFKYCFIL